MDNRDELICVEEHSAAAASAVYQVALVLTISIVIIREWNEFITRGIFELMEWLPDCLGNVSRATMGCALRGNPNNRPKQGCGYFFRSQFCHHGIITEE